MRNFSLWVLNEFIHFGAEGNGKGICLAYVFSAQMSFRFYVSRIFAVFWNHTFQNPARR